MKFLSAGLIIIFVLAAQTVFADENEISDLVSSIQLGMSIEKVKEKIPALQKASYDLKGEMEAYDMKEPKGGLTMLRCAFVKSKFALFTFETIDGLFDKTRSAIETKYGPFIDKEANVLSSQGPGTLSIRMVRTGTDGTAAHVIINDPSILPSAKSD